MRLKGPGTLRGWRAGVLAALWTALLLTGGATDTFAQSHRARPAVLLGRGAGPTTRLLPRHGVRTDLTRRPASRIRPASSETEARLLLSARDAGAARLSLLRSARREILVSSFIFANDRVAQIMMAELRSAARSGVRVRLLVDGIRRGVDRAALAHLVGEGVEVAIFNPVTVRSVVTGRLGYRMHDKLLIVDGESVVVGGRNIEEGYFGFRRPQYRQWTDVDMVLRGEVAREARDYYESLWSSEHVHRLTPTNVSVRPRRLSRAVQTLDHFERLARHSRFGRFADELAQQPATALSNVRFLHESPGTLRTSGRIRAELIQMIDEARSEVEIYTPYLVAQRELLDAVARATERGVSVRFVTNAWGLDAVTPHLAYEATFDELAQAGAEVWEYQGPEALHAKVLVMDGHRVYLGSHNMNTRSRHRDHEVGVVGESTDVANRLLRHGRELRSHAILVAQGGQVTAAKESTCGTLCRRLARWIFRPAMRALGLFSQF